MMRNFYSFFSFEREIHFDSIHNVRQRYIAVRDVNVLGSRPTGNMSLTFSLVNEMKKKKKKSILALKLYIGIFFIIGWKKAGRGKSADFFFFFFFFCLNHFCDEKQRPTSYVFHCAAPYLIENEFYINLHKEFCCG